MTESAVQVEDGVAADRVMAALEALLLVASDPLSPRRAAAVLNLTEAQVRTCFLLLKETCHQRNGGLDVIEVGGGFRLVTRPEFDALVAKLEPSRSQTPLSAAAMETLAIVAYNQPLTRPAIEAVRGVRCEGVLTTLVDRGLLADAGRREGPGRPLLYVTTRRFLEYFGLGDLSDLPPLTRPARGEGEVE